MQPLIALVDCNNFYASCERLFRLDLHNKPIAVLSNNDGCIVARNTEVKALAGNQRRRIEAFTMLGELGFDNIQ